MSFDRDLERMKLIRPLLPDEVPKALAQAIDAVASSFMINGIVKALLMNVKDEGLEASAILCKGLVKFCPPAVSAQAAGASGRAFVLRIVDNLLGIDSPGLWRIVDEESAALLRVMKLYAKALKSET